MDISTPIDTRKAIDNLGGDPNMYYRMLGMFEGMSLFQSLEQVKTGIEELNYQTIKNGAHSLKGSSGYIGASHLHYACYFI